jgi:hypothetical protein
VPLDEAKDNIRASSRLDLPWLKESPPHDEIALVCAGGPSLRDDLQEIIHRSRNGQKIIAINNVANFLWENGIKADYQFIMDALPQSSEYVRDAVGHLLLASQCNPLTFDRARGIPTTLFHPLCTFDVRALLPPEREPEANLIGGGVTALTRCMCVIHTMGYRVQHIFGADSSRRGKDHHAYKQIEDDGLHDSIVVLEGKEYMTSLPMAAQVIEFITYSKALSDLGSVIHVHGDGLLPAASLKSIKDGAPMTVLKSMAMTEAC